MISPVNKGSYRYGLLLVIVMLGASLAGTGATGYCVLICRWYPPFRTVKATNIEINDALWICHQPPASSYQSRASLWRYGDRTRNRGFHQEIFDGALCAGESHHVSGFPRMESYCLPFLPDHPIADASEDALAAREETFNALPARKNIALLPHSLSALSA